MHKESFTACEAETPGHLTATQIAVAWLVITYSNTLHTPSVVAGVVAGFNSRHHGLLSSLRLLQHQLLDA